MKKGKKKFTIPVTSKSGSAWEKFSFAEFSRRYKQESASYGINPVKYLHTLYRGIINEMGVVKGTAVFIKGVTWDLTFNKPKWLPEKFNIGSKEQEAFYHEKFKEFFPL